MAENRHWSRDPISPQPSMPIEVEDESQLDPEMRERIRRRAHEIWESTGHPTGNEQIHWLIAKGEILGH